MRESQNSIDSPLTVFVVAFGGPGDIHPMVALGRALRARGHRVYFISNPYFEKLAHAVGLEFIGYGSAERLAGVVRGAQFESRKTRLLHALVSLSWVSQGLVRWRSRGRSVVDPMRWLYQMISQRYVPGETILVARATAFGARIAQEKLGVPMATVHLQPAMMRSAHDAPGFPLPAGDSPLLRMLRRILWASIDIYADRYVVPETNALRSELGLPRVHRPFSGWVHSPELVIGLFPDWYAPPQPDWPRKTHLVGFPLFDEAGTRPTPSEVESFLATGEPPIVFTSGSAVRHSLRFYEMSVAACGLLGRRGVLLTPGSDFVPTKLPETVRHFEYVPFSTILPRAVAIVHHGGIGTTGLALAAGIPQLVVPFVDDQFDNAVRVRRLGAGLKMSHLAYWPKTVAHNLERLLSSKEIAHTCRSLAARLEQQDPLSEACRLIEKLAFKGA